MVPDPVVPDPVVPDPVVPDPVVPDPTGWLGGDTGVAVAAEVLPDPGDVPVVCGVTIG